MYTLSAFNQLLAISIDIETIDISRPLTVNSSCLARYSKDQMGKGFRLNVRAYVTADTSNPTLITFS